MILYILNGYINDNAGFSKRCQREIDMLSEVEEITVISRKDKKNKPTYENKKAVFIYFDVDTSLVENPKKYFSGFYEMYRNAKLFFPFIISLFTVVKKLLHDKKKIKIYVVSSPMTIALYTLCIIKLFKLQDTILEFHDMEPEMAKHMKHLSLNSSILKIEYFLEKVLCKFYKKIVVTNHVQAAILTQRTGIGVDKLFVLPNSLTNKEYQLLLEQKKTRNKIKETFIVGYIATLRFDYAFLGVCDLIVSMKDVLHKHPEIILTILGDGEGIKIIKNVIQKYQLEKNVQLLGKVDNVASLLATFDVGVIPWNKDDFATTILPTKLFEYLAAAVPVIVPNFGAFPGFIADHKNGLTYSSSEDLVNKIILLKNNEAERIKLAKNGNDSFLSQYKLNYYSKPYTHFITS